MRKLALFLLAAVALWPQVNLSRYTAMKQTALTAAAEKVTVQQPTASTTQVAFETADIFCSVACTVTAQWNGAAATVTALTPVVINGSTPGALAFSGSDVGAGTTGKLYNIPAGSTLVLDISNFYLPRGAGGGANFSLGTNSITGTARIQIQWVER